MNFDESPNVSTYEAFCKCKKYLTLHENVMVLISGGGDSDIMLDFIQKVLKEIENKPQIHYVFFDTGIEYRATKQHLEYLEEKYNITIERYRSAKPVPLGCLQYGVPFISKYVSEMIERLQRHNFKFEDKSYDILIKQYPKCKVALQWWCNAHNTNNGKPSRFSIANNKYLKEFMVENPPTFKISNKCCKGAKKDNSHKIIKQLGIDLCCIGIRKAEGGIRTTAYKSCFTDNKSYETKKTLKSYNDYRPIFWFTDRDKQEYEEYFNIKHSDCYTKYGLKRTGCVGCPFGMNFEQELETAKIHEPLLYQAVNNIFKNSYKYTRQFLDFKRNKNKQGE